MTSTLRLLAVTSVTALLITACASAPEPMPEPEPEPIADLPEPMVEERAPEVIRPLPPVQTQPQGPVPGSIQDFAFQSGGEARVYFGYDQFTLTPEARAKLRQQAQWLTAYRGYDAVIEGHADERGTRQYNIALGARRANSVKAFLVSQGVDPSRLTTVSYGKERPIDARSNEEGWARNRNGFTNLRPSGQS
ncbi:peptidoglycan-associated lipoprotein Pal [Algimonas porphyrae]|uniref:Peptidoglycan-associated lipoprotein n=1 Tax=Algimonas porphyrae TaxID=1128113 RepID=A0ABQ5UY03_9PROT|nr:peptidoglycan-associated lipoprotein Pal [Algimonas porphyrae]GLQ20193.1 hypothetical protein GCM10007854_11480 [Algimonas porphyrae]